MPVFNKFEVGEIVTNNDGNNCENEVLIKRIAPIPVADGESREYLVAFYDPTAPTYNPIMEAHGLEDWENFSCILLSARGLDDLRSLLGGVRLFPTPRTKWTE
jgi:hypothetical protein